MEPSPTSGPLGGVRVLDFTDGLAAYGARLLADLGADVIRVEPPSGGESPGYGPFWLASGTPPTSLFERFVNAGKRSITLDLGANETESLVSDLLASADVILEGSQPILARNGWTDERVRAANSTLIRVLVTPFGRQFDGSDESTVDDLILLGAGGLLHLGGYPDVGPVAVYGHQSSYMASIFTAAAAVAGLIGQVRGTEPLTADVSAQECVAQALEESVVRYAMTGEVRAPQGDVAKEAGTGVYRCADGYVSMVAGRLGTSAAWAALIAWIIDEEPDLAAELADDRWSQFEFRQRPETIEAFREIFERFTTDRTRQELYRDAQQRGIALSPVNDLVAVLDDAQLRSREFFVEVEDPEIGRAMTYPGLPYRMSGTPLRGPRPAPRRGAANVDVFIKEAGLTVEELESLAARGVV